MASVPFNNLITFSRGGNATLTGPNGLIQWAPNNLLTNSEQFDNAAWQKFGGGVATAPAVTANAGIAPDGTTTADRVQFALNGGATSTDRSLLSQSATLATSFPYTYSIWVRSLSGTLSMGIGCDNLVGNTPITVTTTWQRFTVSGTATGTAGVALLQLRGGQAPTQSNAADVLVWGAQVELGSAATTYNSTTVKNLLGYSEAFDNAAWSKTRASIVTGAQANPVNGAFNAQKLMVDTTAAATHSVSQEFSLGVSVPVTASVYVKAAEYTTGRLVIVALSGAFPEINANFNLTAGTVTTSASVGATVLGSSITQLSNGWYRVSISGFTGLSGLHRITINPNTNSPFTGDGNSGVYIYGAQLSDSASLDPYVPTPAAAPSSTAYYGPRFDYDPVTRVAKGILIEEQRVNLLTYSDQFDNAAWNKSSVTVTANTVSAPDGTATADTLTSSGASGTIFQPTPSTSASFTYSVYVRSGTVTTVELQIAQAGNGFKVAFNLTSGTAGTAAIVGTGGTVSAMTGAIVSAGGGWYRCSVSYTSGGVGNAFLNIPAAGVVYAWGAQLEAGAFPTSYIPTVASTVTRSADVATISGSLFSQWYNQPQGTIVSTFSSFATGSSSRIVAELNDGTSNNRYTQVHNPAGSDRFLTFSGGSAVVTTLDYSAVGVNIISKWAGAYAAGNYGASLNGAAALSATYGSVLAGVNLLAIGGSAGGVPLNGHVRSIDYFPARLADFQLQALTELPLVATLNLDFINGTYDA